MRGHRARSVRRFLLDAATAHRQFHAAVVRARSPLTRAQFLRTTSAMTNPSSLLLAVIVACGLAMACSSTKTGSGGGAPATGPEKACLDTVEGIARAAERCGQNYQANYDAGLKGAAGGDCKKIIGIRDEAALRQTCLPSLQTVPCPDLLAGKIDASCGKQLQRPASFEPELNPASFLADVIAD